MLAVTTCVVAVNLPVFCGPQPKHREIVLAIRQASQAKDFSLRSGRIYAGLPEGKQVLACSSSLEFGPAEGLDACGNCGHDARSRTVEFKPQARRPCRKRAGMQSGRSCCAAQFFSPPSWGNSLETMFKSMGDEVIYFRLPDFSVAVDGELLAGKLK